MQQKKHTSFVAFLGKLIQEAEKQSLEARFDSLRNLEIAEQSWMNRETTNQVLNRLTN